MVVVALLVVAAVVVAVGAVLAVVACQRRPALDSDGGVLLDIFREFP
jgi:hypothetical protein